MAAMINGQNEGSKTHQLAITLPQSPGITIYLHLNVLSRVTTVFLTNSTAESSQSSTAMGSLIYAIPDRYNPSQPMTTTLYSVPSSIDFATRLAKLLTRRTGKPCYVGNSINLAGAAGGGSPEEEMEVFRSVVQIILQKAGVPNGTST